MRKILLTMKAKSQKSEQLTHPESSAEDVSAPRPAPVHVSPGFRHILVAIDFSESAANAFEYASALAQKFNSELTLLHVVEPTVYSPNALLGSPSMEEAGEHLLTTSRERLRKLKHKASSQGLTTEALVRMGRAQSDIADTAKAIGADLIVMGTHGRSSSRQSLLGGTAERVLRYTSCPVLAVPLANL